jgi:hypothetical protein
MKNMEPWAFKNVFPIRGTSQEWGKVWPEQFRPDVLYVDGSHRYIDVLNDCRIWWPLVKPKGLVFWHDVNELDVDNALNAFAAEEKLVLSKPLLWGPYSVITKFVRKDHAAWRTE